MNGHDITVSLWENNWGREGLWCRDCRRTTPVHQLVVREGRAVLFCETCRAHLCTGPTWLTSIERHLVDAALVSAR